MRVEAPSAQPVALNLTTMGTDALPQTPVEGNIDLLRGSSMAELLLNYIWISSENKVR